MKLCRCNIEFVHAAKNVAFASTEARLSFPNVAPSVGWKENDVPVIKKIFYKNALLLNEKYYIHRKDLHNRTNNI